MPDALIPLAIPEARRALAEMFVDLALAFHATTVLPDQRPGEIDANESLVAVAVMLGHAEGHAMNASEIAARLTMPRTSVLRRLDALVETGLIKRIESRYYLDPRRARRVPHHDRFELILSKAFAVLGPHLSKLDK
jgi:DNA-binding transcriptional ArsR family regulator